MVFFHLVLSFLLILFSTFFTLIVLELIFQYQDLKYKKYKKGADFIQTYVFPGGMLACESVFKNEIKEAELKIINELWFSLDYAKTLQNWQILFEKNIRKIEELGLTFS